MFEKSVFVNDIMNTTVERLGDTVASTSAVHDRPTSVFFTGHTPFSYMLLDSLLRHKAAHVRYS